MIIEKIVYQKLFPIGSYLNEKIGLEVSISNGDNIEEVFKQLKSQVENLHIQNNPHLQPQEEPDVPVTSLLQKSIDVVKKPKPTPTENMIRDINTCTNSKVLVAVYEKFAKNNSSIQDAYDKKLQELTA